MNSNPTRNNSDANNKTQSATDLKGMWGGDHISMEVTDHGASIDYDCAHGSITETIEPSREGKFVVKGFHVTEHPGPIREGQDQLGRPASYNGAIDGDAMTLTVTLDNDINVGTFKLTHGKVGRIRKCG